MLCSVLLWVGIWCMSIFANERTQPKQALAPTRRPGSLRPLWNPTVVAITSWWLIPSTTPPPRLEPWPSPSMMASHNPSAPLLGDYDFGFGHKGGWFVWDVGQALTRCLRCGGNTINCFPLLNMQVCVHGDALSRIRNQTSIIYPRGRRVCD